MIWTSITTFTFLEEILAYVKEVPTEEIAFIREV